MGKLFDLEANGYFYSRLQNPTCDYVAAKICALEGGTAAMLTSSGQAANFFALFNVASCGDHIVASSSIYGGTFNLISVTMAKMGVETTFVAPDCSEEELNAAFRPNTKCVFGETIANPALTVLDIEKFARAAHGHGVPLIVDNTFATPVGCRPFEWGADIVTHSTTKYMDGHGTAGTHTDDGIYVVEVKELIGVDTNRRNTHTVTHHGYFLPFVRTREAQHTTYVINLNRVLQETVCHQFCTQRVTRHNHCLCNLTVLRTNVRSRTIFFCHNCFVFFKRLIYR